MSTLEIPLIFIVIFLVVIIFYLLIKYRRPTQSTADELMVGMLHDLKKEVKNQALQQRLDRALQQINQHQYQVTEQFLGQQDKNQQLVQDITAKLTEMESTHQQILGFAQQMKSLERILQNPKQRGIFGEYILEQLLANILSPNQYVIQYRFKNKERVDAAIFFRDKIVPVDAKFSLDKYNQIMKINDKKRQQSLSRAFMTDIKNRIDETAKYVRPKENTTDFAFMFIPAEGVYHYILSYQASQQSHNLIEYAFQKKVMLVSPMSFYAYLSTVLQGLKALQIEESIKEVVKKVGQLEQHLKVYEEYMERLGKHLQTTTNAYHRAKEAFGKIDKEVAVLKKE